MGVKHPNEDGVNDEGFKDYKLCKYWTIECNDVHVSGALYF